MSELLGVVLCGGESKRMGSDKGMMKTNGIPWAALVANKLRAFTIPVVASIQSAQIEKYSELFSKGQLVIDEVGIEGPLKGLLSVHQKFPARDILLMACDLIDMDENTLGQLIDHYKTHPGFDFFAYYDEFAEPFCAIYTSRGLSPVLAKAREHSLEKFSFQTILSEGHTMRLPIADRNAFTNYNTIPGHHKE